MWRNCANCAPCCVCGGDSEELYRDIEKLRAALRRAVNALDETYEGEGCWPQNRDPIIAELRKEFDL